METLRCVRGEVMQSREGLWYRQHVPLTQANYYANSLKLPS